jgi:hypothetical protein
MEPYLMFQGVSNWDLIALIRNIRRNKLGTYKGIHIDRRGDLLPTDGVGAHESILMEIELQEHAKVRESQFKFLNRSDLLDIIYMAIIDEIKVIDEAPYEKLDALKYRQWSCPQLVERIEHRIKSEGK